MGLVDLLLLLLVAGVSGAIGQAVSGYARGGWLSSIGIGFIGAVIGTWLARQLDLSSFFVVEIGGTSFPIIWAIIGGALLSVVLGYINKSRK